MQILVTSTVDVELNESAFTERFMEEFRESFFPFYSIREHAEHIAQLAAREAIEEVNGNVGANQFVEGYGPIGDFVKSIRIDGMSIDSN